MCVTSQIPFIHLTVHQIDNEIKQLKVKNCVLLAFVALTQRTMIFK